MAGMRPCGNAPHIAAAFTVVVAAGTIAVAAILPSSPFRAGQRESVPNASVSTSGAVQWTGGSAVPSSHADQTCTGNPVSAPSGASTLAGAVQAVEHSDDASVQLSWYDPSRGVVTVGDLEDFPAWSTMKVPLSLAVIQAGAGHDHQDEIAAALENSDNSAADVLWNSLGDSDTERANAVTEVLRTGGDEATTVPTQTEWAGYSIFGQTQWDTAHQVSFLTRLPCLTGAGEVVAAMSAVSADQRWGLGRQKSAAFKGGWGPTHSGGYTARQLGWFPDGQGNRVIVAMAAQAGSFNAATAVLDELSARLG